jgi:1,4-alpha-glucan branching enzyme
LKESRDEEWNIHEIWKVLNDRLPGVRTIAYAESHDQALVGDKTLAFWLMDKEMYWHMGKEDQNIVIDRGIALHKMLRFITLALGGNAYLNFMGNEFGHPEWIDFPREGNNWSFMYARRQWSLKEDNNLKYHYLSDFDKDMITIAKEKAVLNQEFATQINMDELNRTIVFSKGGLLFVFNFHPFNSIPDYEIKLDQGGSYKVILCSDRTKYGGHGRVDENLEYFTQFSSQNESNLLRIYATNRTAILLEKIS